MAGLSSPGSEAAVSPGLVSSVTPVPASDVSQQSSDNESGGAKDENGQDIVCVVCNDKSSGKHYGQFTCEGKDALSTLLMPSLILDLPAPSVHYLCSGQQTTLRITRPIYQGVSGHCALCSYSP